MANSKSALKRVRQIAVRTERNKSLKTRVKTLHNKTVAAVEAGDKEAAQASLSDYSSAVDICAKKGIFHANKAANLKSKAAKQVKG
ncbi:30S ribosomal protein S20 [Persicirhabdus sediminis]|uniref:Small ribosomal subunit protein bS20 n=1 Tax=Persicirhabdus sediminis TaxID=454144 RepID=A0A8J7MIY8_9BACT|nr:30S ribosomal protein S20 [Persicirhabdus sediminis]MBK1791848.1 30S ribosomal protein S20 [Persicirhabdus sediminis]